MTTLTVRRLAPSWLPIGIASYNNLTEYANTKYLLAMHIDQRLLHKSKKKKLQHEEREYFFLIADWRIA